MQIFLPKEFKIYAEKIADKYNCKVLNITFKKENKSNILRVTIDGANTSLDTCASISRNLSRWLDRHEEEIKCDNYNLEVSSAGIDRKLTTKEDFQAIIGKIVSFNMKTKAEDGRKKYKGEVISCKDGIVNIYTKEESTYFDILISDISKASIEYTL